MGLAVAIIVLLLDQGSKFLVQSRMTEGMSIPIINHFLYLTYVRNPGAAFGLLAYRTQLFELISLVVVGIIVYYYRKVPQEWIWLRIALAMQAGGALGNMLDRVRYGRVIDFIDFRVWSYIFNLADSAIVIGSCILAYYLLRGGTPQQEATPSNTKQGKAK
ncbi:MAG: signal peptidase II [Peptococcaceae bacterium]|nr:signal peptidase II [Peptococcaceae bacterium]